MILPEYRYLFGPVTSRRLGISLGVDLMPHKTCSMNCVYCECGASTNLTVERKEYVPTSAIIDDLDRYLAAGPELDVITFSGAGEPTLHIDFAKIVAHIKKHYPAYRMVLLTNATMLHHDDIIEAVTQLNIIIPSLDAVSNDAFRRINRPHPGLHPQQIIDALAHIRAVTAVEMWLEIFIVPGINDTMAELASLKNAINTIGPDRIQLNSLDRPPAAGWVQPASYEQLSQIAAYIGPKAEIIARFPTAKTKHHANESLHNAIIQLIRRRPCTMEDLSATLGHAPSDIERELDQLMEQHHVQQDRLDRGIFYRLVEETDEYQSDRNQCA